VIYDIFHLRIVFWGILLVVVVHALTNTKQTMYVWMSAVREYPYTVRAIVSGSEQLSIAG